MVIITYSIHIKFLYLFIISLKFVSCHEVYEEINFLLKLKKCYFILFNWHIYILNETSPLACLQLCVYPNFYTQYQFNYKECG